MKGRQQPLLRLLPHRPPKRLPPPRHPTRTRTRTRLLMACVRLVPWHRTDNLFQRIRRSISSISINNINISTSIRTNIINITISNIIRRACLAIRRRHRHRCTTARMHPGIACRHHRPMDLAVMGRLVSKACRICTDLQVMGCRWVGHMRITTRLFHRRRRRLPVTRPRLQGSISHSLHDTRLRHHRCRRRRVIGRYPFRPGQVGSMRRLRWGRARHRRHRRLRRRLRLRRRHRRHRHRGLSTVE